MDRRSVAEERKKREEKEGQREAEIFGNGRRREERREGQREEKVCVLRGVNHGCCLMDGSGS